MKKRIIAIIISMMLLSSLALTGCGDSFSKIKIADKQDYSYTVYSNGGNSVQYGNYIYFVNGTRGYDDLKGEDNLWPNVVKGALYRAQLTGKKSADKVGDFDIAPAGGTTLNKGLEFVSTIGKDYNENDTDVVSTQLIAPKTIGTSGYKEGGVFIFDEYVYFASPNNEKDKSGKIQTAKTDFFRARLDGKDVIKVYTTEADSATSPYAFYKYGDATYLVCLDGATLKSIKMPAGKKADKPVTIASKVKSVLLPYNTTYYKGMPTNSLNDFVYILRDTVEGEIKTGTAIEVMRPDGKEGGTYNYTGKVDTLEDVRDGMLFYRSKNSSNNDAIYYDNLHSFMMKNSPSYKSYQDGLKDTDHNKITSNISGELFSTAAIADYTDTYCFRPGGVNSNVVYAIGVKAGGAYLLSNINQPTSLFYNAGLTLSFVENEYAYFTATDGKILYRTKWNKAASDKTEQELKEQISKSDMVDNGLRADYCAGYIVYFSKIDEWANGYAMFKKVDGVEGAEHVFIGNKIKADIKPTEEEEKKQEEEKPETETQE